ncbi:MAG: MCE family protein [Streptosporangiales bacterium]|nr:MCE family protein [Streptosporangiales bacterium]
MNSRLVRYQLIAFVLVTVLGIGYAMAAYSGLGPILGLGRYHLSVRLPDTGGLYAGADVTERGVTVGRVDAIIPHTEGITADISVDNGTRISASGLKADVRSVSAVGEQYLEFIPRGSAPPYLGSGSVVPEREVSLPPSTTQLLASVNALLRSVPRQQLTTTVNELYTAFNGSGPQLRQLLASSRALLSAAQQDITPTRQLVSGLRPVLSTQAADSADLAAISRNLDALSAQLRDSNPDLSGTLAQLPGFISQLNDLVGQLQPTVPLLLASLTSVGQVLNVYLPNVRQLFVILPADINDVTAVVMDSGIPGALNADFLTESGTPPACEQGYHTPVRDPADTSAKPPPTPSPHCAVPANSPQDVRGDRNNPCPNNPAIRSLTAAGCGLYFGDTAAATGNGGKPAGSGPAGDSAGTYDPTSGLLYGPDGDLYSVGQSTLHHGPTSLSGLLKQTLGD